jgi:hypothetical protein
MTGNDMQINWPLFVALGVLFWLIGVIFVRVAGAPIFTEGNLQLVSLYLFSIPVAWVMVKGTARTHQLSGIGVLLAVVIMCFTALLLDGVVIAWLPSLYGVTTSAHSLVAAWLLWFVGISLCISIMITRSAAKNTVNSES